MKRASMRIEPIPIHHFVETVYGSAQVTKLVSEWRLEPALVIGIVVGSFRSLGIYFVYPNQIDMCTQSVIHHLTYAPEIQTLVERAKRESDLERVRQQRHGDY